ncbi:MAG TPA: nuclear transport factor 2 family protein, partial [Solirubrobacteraceae bacterium]|nr:nuclear transport factor 2 family protein [Solirubrobacteraceae bacterium]
IVAESPDATAEVERRAASGTVALGVLRMSGTRAGRPFGTAQALLTALADDGTVAVGEVFAVGDREHALERFEDLAGERLPEAAEPAPAELGDGPAVDPWERHADQLRRWTEWFDAHDLERLLGAMAPGFRQVDHRDVADPAPRGREGVQTMTASSFELVEDLRAETELLAVDGDRRVARVAYAGAGMRMTTWVLARLDGDLLASQDVYDDADDALAALEGHARVRTPVQ